MESQESTTGPRYSPDSEPSLEYAGTSGNVNVDTSRDATIHADTTGITAKAQRYALIVAAQQGRKGVTVVELREKDNSLHHGRISAALSNLHKAGRLVALRERRGHAGIYVLPEYVEGREARPFRPNKASRQVDPEVIVGVLLAHNLLASLRPEVTRCTCGGWTWQPGDSFKNHVAREIAAVLDA